jgi:predicted RNase H-like nuclease (RuvC/YqgF family)
MAAQRRVVFDIAHPGISVYRALLDKELNEEERAQIIAEAIDNISKAFPNLKDTITIRELGEAELKLTKEIEDTRKEIKELELKLTKEIENTRKEIKELDAKLTREIKELDVKIKNVELKLTQEIKNSKVEIIKWISGMLFVQVVAIGALFFGAIKILF